MDNWVSYSNSCNELCQLKCEKPRYKGPQSLIYYTKMGRKIKLLQSFNCKNIRTLKNGIRDSAGSMIPGINDK